MANLDRSNCSAVLLAEGAPCQPFSLSSNDLIHHYVAIRDALAEHCHRQGVDFQWFFEEISTTSEKHSADFSRLLSSSLVIIQSADFGWVHLCCAYRGTEAQPSGCCRPTVWTAISTWAFLPSVLDRVA